MPPLKPVSDGQYFQLYQKRASDVAVTAALEPGPSSVAEDLCDQTIARIPKSHGRNSGAGRVLQTDGGVQESIGGVLSLDKSGGVDFLSLTEELHS